MHAYACGRPGELAVHQISRLLQTPGQQPGRDYTCEKIATRLLRTIISAVSHHLHTLPIKRRRDTVYIVARNRACTVGVHGVRARAHGVSRVSLFETETRTERGECNLDVFARFSFFRSSFLNLERNEANNFLDCSASLVEFARLETETDRDSDSDYDSDSDSSKDNDSD